MTEDAMAMNMISVPPASGSIEPIRKVSKTPARPPKTLQMTKFPIFMRPT